MKICLVMSKYCAERLTEYHEWMDTDESAGYVRLSEIVDVELPRLTNQATIEKQLRQIDAKERELRITFQRELNSIAAERQNLLALPNHA